MAKSCKAVTTSYAEEYHSSVMSVTKGFHCFFRGSCSGLRLHAQMVPYQEADPQELYTLSPKGITLTWADGQGSDLTPPQRWEKECTMFRRLKRQRLFRDFHGYKPFR